MGRGRPKKNPTPETNNVNKSTDSKENNNNGAEEPRKKRKYTRRKKPEQNKADDDTVIKPEAKRRGRKRGRKKKEQDLYMKPDEIVDYIIRNFPNMGIEKIREKVLNGIKIMKKFGDSPYLLYKFTYEGNVYYYDDKNSILNSDGQLVGFFIKQNEGVNKMYMINQKNVDNRTYQQVIDSIEKK
jgi:hypothetical protein